MRKDRDGIDQLQSAHREMSRGIQQHTAPGRGEFRNPDLKPGGRTTKS